MTSGQVYAMADELSSYIKMIGPIKTSVNASITQVKVDQYGKIVDSIEAQLKSMNEKLSSAEANLMAAESETRKYAAYLAEEERKARERAEAEERTKKVKRGSKR